MKVSARVADPGDLERLAELASEAIEATAKQRGGPLLVSSPSVPARGRRDSLDPDSIGDHIREAMGREDSGLWVGAVEEVVVGLAAASVRSSAGGAVIGSVDALFVELDARGVGVGAAMLEQALGWLDGKACSGVDALALPGDRSTKSFLEAAGFKARLLVMHRERS